MNLQAIKGFKDILPPDAPQWRVIEEAARSIFEAHGYREIRPPILEYTELFTRSIGQATDIVEKEMFTFEDRGGYSISLRPEGTAGVVRAYIEHGLYKSDPKSKLYYIGPMFRRERPQKGRFRQFHQIGAEAFGIAGALVDAELITMESLLFERLGILDLDLAINSLGCRNCRPAYREKLVKFLQAIPDEKLCPDCLRRRETNPMRVLDCKNEGCRAAVEQAPVIFNDLCEDCRKHHYDLEKYLKHAEIKYRIDPRIVRGLDYYTRTAFEFLSNRLGSQSAVSAGGRYDNLVEELGGPPTPGVGFAIGMERVALLLPEASRQDRPDIFFALLGDEAIKFALPLIKSLRASGIKVEMDYEGRGLKGQMKQANKSGAIYSVIIGEGELKTGEAILQNMANGEKTTIKVAEEVGKLSENIRRYVGDHEK